MTYDARALFELLPAVYRTRDAEQGGARPDYQDRHAPPPARRPRQVKYDPNEAVDRHFRHDPAHQR